MRPCDSFTESTHAEILNVAERLLEKSVLRDRESVIVPFGNIHKRMDETACFSDTLSWTGQLHPLVHILRADEPSLARAVTFDSIQVTEVEEATDSVCFRSSSTYYHFPSVGNRYLTLDDCPQAEGVRYYIIPS